MACHFTRCANQAVHKFEKGKLTLFGSIKQKPDKLGYDSNCWDQHSQDMRWWIEIKGMEKGGISDQMNDLDSVSCESHEVVHNFSDYLQNLSSVEESLPSPSPPEYALSDITTFHFDTDSPPTAPCSVPSSEEFVVGQKREECTKTEDSDQPLKRTPKVPSQT